MKTPIRFALIALTLFFLVSCKKDDKESNTSKYPFYFSGTINSKAVKFEVDNISTTYGCGISQPESLSGYDNNDIYEGTVIANMTDLSKNSIYVHILKFFSEYPTEVDRINMIKVGSYGYGHSDVSPSTVNGASIDYYDANGNYWSSENGPQTGSAFNITELIDNTDGTSMKIFKAGFNCKLYNEDGTQSIELTNGVIRGKVLFP